MSEPWRIWDRWPEYGRLLFRRAVGVEGEMESAKALALILSRFYRPGMRVLDVGCGAGHYLRTLRARLDPEIDYLGVDATAAYVDLAREAYGEPERFEVGDIHALPFADGRFDIVLCMNVIENLPPPPTPALHELLRVSNGCVVVRTLFGTRNYIVKELRTLEETGEALVAEEELIRPDGEAVAYHYNNMYTESYLRAILAEIAPGVRVGVERDTHWGPFDNRGLIGPTAAKAAGVRQISGNLILDWRFMTLRKPRAGEPAARARADRADCR